MNYSKRTTIAGSSATTCIPRPPQARRGSLGREGACSKPAAARTAKASKADFPLPQRSRVATPPVISTPAPARPATSSTPSTSTAGPRKTVNDFLVATPELAAIYYIFDPLEGDDCDLIDMGRKEGRPVVHKFPLSPPAELARVSPWADSRDDTRPPARPIVPSAPLGASRDEQCCIPTESKVTSTTRMTPDCTMAFHHQHTTPATDDHRDWVRSIGIAVPDDELYPLDLVPPGCTLGRDENGNLAFADMMSPPSISSVRKPAPWEDAEASSSDAEPAPSARTAAAEQRNTPASTSATAMIETPQSTIVFHHSRIPRAPAQPENDILRELMPDAVWDNFEGDLVDIGRDEDGTLTYAEVYSPLGRSNPLFEAERMVDNPLFGW